MAHRRLHVILVEPQYSGNLGFAARAMKNFGVVDLHLVNPMCPIDNECRNRAVHAQDVLDNARVYATLDEALQGIDHSAAFAARAFANDKSHGRAPIGLEAYADLVGDTSGEIALVFGREDDGLSNEDVERCDIVVTIPTHAMYRSMNLSHAVSVALYAITKDPTREPKLPSATDREKELLNAYVRRVLDLLAYPPHRVEMTSMAFKRVLGRAGLSKWEYHRVMGIFHGMLKFANRYPELREDYEAMVRATGDEGEGPGQDR